MKISKKPNTVAINLRQAAVHNPQPDPKDFVKIFIELGVKDSWIALYHHHHHCRTLLKASQKFWTWLCFYPPCVCGQAGRK